MKDIRAAVLEWEEDIDDYPPSHIREDGFKDAVDPSSSWNNRYERGTEEWETYAHGFDEGKEFLEKKSGKAARREAFLELLTLTIMHTPESEHFDADEAVPFFSETYLYALVGKQDARTILAYLRNLMEACGFERWELEKQVARVKE